MKRILKFLPLLGLYIVYIFLHAENNLFGDEIRYVEYARNLAQGFYTTQENPNLINGPGYPLYLAAYLVLGLDLAVPLYSNAVLFFLAVILFYKTLLLYVPKKKALLFSYGLGLYWPLIIALERNNTEGLAILLVCSFVYFMARLHHQKASDRWNTIFAAMSAGYLALTRDIFFYVILVSLMALGVYFLFFRDKRILKSAKVLSLAFLVICPYLLYTYSLTGRYFYLSSNGGEQLYWMSSRGKGEYGSFVSIDSVYEGRYKHVPTIHTQFIESIYHLPYVERNDALVEKSVQNILSNPVGYLKNLIANALRLVGNGPSSWEYQGWYQYEYLFTNLVFVLPVLLGLYPIWLYRKYIPTEMYVLAGFMLIYTGGSLAVAAISRYFALVIPVLILWAAFVYTHFVQISFENKLAKKQTLPRPAIFKPKPSTTNTSKKKHFIPKI